VEIDGDFNGVTPRTKAVGPGMYKITVRKKGFNDWTQSATLDQGSTLAVHAKLSPLAVETDGDANNGQLQRSKRKGNTGITISGLP